MNKYFLPSILIALQFFLNSLGWFSWSLFDGPVALAVMFAFFHSLDARDAVLYAVFCGLSRDLFSLDVFGLSALSYGAVVFLVLFSTRFINRQNGFFVFPVVFIASLLCPYVTVVFKSFFAQTAVPAESGVFFIRSFFQAVGTTALAFPLYALSKTCGLGLTES